MFLPQCTHGETRPKEGKRPLPYPSYSLHSQGACGWAGVGLGPVLSPSLLCSLGVPRGCSRDYAFPSFVATPHLVFVCSILCSSVWDNSLQAGSVPWEQSRQLMSFRCPDQTALRQADAQRLVLIADACQWWWCRKDTSSFLHRLLNSQLGCSRCQCFTPETPVRAAISRRSGKRQ